MPKITKRIKKPTHLTNNSESKTTKELKVLIKKLRKILYS